MVGTVRIMACPAVLADRRMLPDKRSALLRMALVAGVSHSFANKGLPARLAMRAVTGTTIELALEKWMSERLQSRVTLNLVTVATDFVLGAGLHHRVARRMARMAVRAGNLVVTMRPAMPSGTDIAVVTVQALRILHLRFGSIRVAETDYGRTFVAAAYTSGMGVSGTVTGFALQLAMPEWTARVARYSMFRAKHCEYGVIFMARQTGIRAFATVLGLLRLCDRVKRYKYRERDCKCRCRDCPTASETRPGSVGWLAQSGSSG